jgi:effector-binding domain-containing protein
MSSYEIQVKTVEPQRVAILREVIEKENQVGQLFKTVHRTLRQHDLQPAGPQFAIYFDEEYTPRDLDVAAAVPVAEGATLPADNPVRIDELPGALMVSLLRVGPWDDFQPAYEAIMDWVKANGYEIVGPNREVHLVGPRSDAPPAEWEMEIQFPIQKQ